MSNNNRTLFIVGSYLITALLFAAGGYFYSKAIYKKDIPAILKPIRDSMIASDLITDSLIKESKKWKDKKPEIEYQIIYREKRKVDEAKTYFKLDTGGRVAHFRNWVRSLPAAPDSIR